MMARATTGRRTREDLLRDIAREPLAATVAHELRTRCGATAADETVVVGVSGGPDSTALLLVLAALAFRRSEPSPAPIAVCVHHGLRAAADEECAAVARLARSLGVACERVHVRPAGRPGNLSANARQDRYDALVDAALRHGATLVAAAHHADDRLETMLLALARGKGLRGMASPRWQRSLGHGIRLVRPLLGSTKAECVGLCERFDIPWFEDPSNEDPARGRGHLRRAVLPGLLARAPRIAEQASHLADEAAVALGALDRLVRRRFGERNSWPRSLFRGCDPTLAAWALRRAAIRCAPSGAAAVPRRAWQQAARAACDCKGSPRRFDWPHGVSCSITAHRVTVGPSGATGCDA